MFDCLYEDILGEHAPLKQVRIRGNQVPFMNEQWRKAIRQKNRLWKRFIRERTDTNYELYKRQGNICTSLRRKAIKTFFDKKSESENPREFWDTYRPFLHSRKSTQANDIILKEHDVVVTDKKQMAIAGPIAAIMNHSIRTGQYPSRWKLGQVTPLFKKDDELNKSNYRPVTVLPALNNVFERLLSAQMGDFYQNILSEYVSAYRRYHSCETSLLRLTEDWRQWICQKLSTPYLMLCY